MHIVYWCDDEPNDIQAENLTPAKNYMYSILVINGKKADRQSRRRWLVKSARLVESVGKSYVYFKTRSV